MAYVEKKKLQYHFYLCPLFRSFRIDISTKNFSIKCPCLTPPFHQTLKIIDEVWRKRSTEVRLSCSPVAFSTFPKSTTQTISSILVLIYFSGLGWFLRTLSLHYTQFAHVLAENKIIFPTCKNCTFSFLHKKKYILLWTIYGSKNHTSHIRYF